MTVLNVAVVQVDGSRAVTVGPHDLLIIHAPKTDCERVAEQLKRLMVAFPNGERPTILVVDASYDLSVLREKDLPRLGWVRVAPAPPG